MKISQEDEILV